MHDWESRRSLGGELKRFTVVANLVLFLSIWAATAKGQFPPAPGTGPGLPETIEAIESARITTRILYVTAHPDDESAAVLTYLARGLHADVALLSLTRGEGGAERPWPRTSAATGIDPDAGIAGGNTGLRCEALLYASQRFWLFENAGKKRNGSGATRCSRTWSM